MFDISERSGSSNRNSLLSSTSETLEYHKSDQDLDQGWPRRVHPDIRYSEFLSKVKVDPVDLLELLVSGTKITYTSSS
jgi:hypothetical protein